MLFLKYHFTKAYLYEKYNFVLPFHIFMKYEKLRILKYTKL